MTARQRAVAERGRPYRDPDVCLRRRLLAAALAAVLFALGILCLPFADKSLALLCVLSSGAVLGFAAGTHRPDLFRAPLVRPPRPPPSFGIQPADDGFTDAARDAVHAVWAAILRFRR